MLVTLQWINDYTDIKVSAKEFCDRMIMSGSNLETCREYGTGIEGVRLGRIDKIEKHPDADKLVVCKINLGKEGELQIVTGAPNVYEGAYVPVAVDGSRIPGPLHGQPKTEGGVEIKSGEIRGVKSEGMLCSPQELGLDDKVAPMPSKDGIWLIPGNWDDHLGELFADALELEDTVVDFEITPNRPDCLAMLGMAREASAVFEEELRYPDTKCEHAEGKASDYVSVEVKTPSCKRYTARVIKDVKIEQSPWWMQKRLMAAGMRPINNIVDITNFVMLEYGQPLHAFSLADIEDNHIIVDMAEEGEKFVTLDGKERTLFDDSMVICDSKKPVAIAGVMGGLNSEISGDTDAVVIESASFVGSSVRFTSKKLGLRTEASARFEKGIDPNLCEAAADRACRLVELLGCGKVVDGSVDIYPDPETAPTVMARVSRINKVLGTDIPREDMEKYLAKLEMKVEGEGDEMYITPPSIRQDLLEEVDYVEEVGRMYGFDNLPMTLPKADTVGEVSKSWALRKLTREVLCGMGANEIQTFSFLNNKTLDQMGIEEDSWERNMVEIINPMGEDTASMRTILTPGMLEVLGRNYSRNVEAVRAYEIGLTYMKNLIDPDDLPVESRALTIGLYGEGEDFFTLKGMITGLLDKLGVKEYRFVAESEYKVYHPGRCARVVARDWTGEDVELGIMGELHPDVAENYGIGTRAYVCELFFDLIVELANKEIHYHQPPKYPSTSRDIAMIVDEDVQVGDIEAEARAAGTEILREIKLFDVYRGKQVEEGKKSVAFSFTYRHDDRTLKDTEVEEVHQNIVDTLRDKFNAVIRDNA